jgi:hypothetical protein
LSKSDNYARKLFGFEDFFVNQFAKQKAEENRTMIELPQEYVEKINRASQELGISEEETLLRCIEEFDPTLSREKRSNSNKYIKRMSVTLSAQTQKQLEQIAETKGITQNSAICDAIRTAYMVQEALQEKNKVILERPNGERVQIEFI